MSRRRGISALEVLIATVIAAMMGYSIVVLLFQGSHEAMVSEDYMLAEALAQRHLAEAMSIPWPELEEALPWEEEIHGLPEEDRILARLHEEYARNLEGPAAFRGKLAVREVEPGLVSYEVSLRWPTKPGSRVERRYSLLRLRTRKDIAITSNHSLRLRRERYATGGGVR